MQKITTHLWYDDAAEEAARLYASLFDGSEVKEPSRYDGPSSRASGRPEGSPMTVPFRLAGTDFLALNGGPHFRFTPAISLFVTCDTGDEVDRLYAGLADAGGVLMPLGEYPFSPRYAWVADRWGLTWQLSQGPGGDRIAPSLLFVGEQHGKCEEALRFYATLFDDSRVGRIERYTADDPDPATGAIKYAELVLAGQPFRAMESSLAHDFAFNEAVSFLVSCEDQAEVDGLWSALTDGGEEGECGWLKDRYGVSWQIVPRALPSLIGDPDPARRERAMTAMLGMKKLDIAALERAADGAST